jgi:hypothetical protein
MGNAKPEYGHMLRHKAIAVMQALKSYCYPLEKPKAGSPGDGGIEEIDESRRPIGEGHMLRVLVGSYVDSLPDKVLPFEGHRLWCELCDSSTTGDFAETAGKAREFHDWLEQQVGVNERMVFHHDERIVRLDGEAYGDLRVEAVKILDFMYKNRHRYVTHSDLSKNVPGCRGDEKTIRRHIDSLPPDLRGLIRSKRGKGRCLVLPGD